jgi:hypothetical protein
MELQRLNSINTRLYEETRRHHEDKGDVSARSGVSRGGEEGTSEERVSQRRRTVSSARGNKDYASLSHSELSNMVKDL